MIGRINVRKSLRIIICQLNYIKAWFHQMISFERFLNPDSLRQADSTNGYTTFDAFFILPRFHACLEFSLLLFLKYWQGVFRILNSVLYSGLTTMLHRVKLIRHAFQWFMMPHTIWNNKFVSFMAPLVQ